MAAPADDQALSYSHPASEDTGDSYHWETWSDENANPSGLGEQAQKNPVADVNPYTGASWIDVQSNFTSMGGLDAAFTRQDGPVNEFSHTAESWDALPPQLDRTVTSEDRLGEWKSTRGIASFPSMLGNSSSMLNLPDHSSVDQNASMGFGDFSGLGDIGRQDMELSDPAMDQLSLQLAG